MLCVTVITPNAGMGGTAQSQNAPEPAIRILEPEPRGGEAYELVYHVPVPANIYWRFKTDFDNSFLTDSELIEEHRFIRRTRNVVITEEKYAFDPDTRYRWQTILYPEEQRLEFTLLNPEECGQKFHYGSIEIEAKGRTTQVTQTAYFDFFGASLWVRYPWSGGMRDMLRTTADWEQKVVHRIRNRYAAP
ncbi:MAG: hypothetical protein V5B78_05190 [Desulfohalobiaceae bacterium]